MKDLNLNELLRYFIVGVFVITATYFLTEKHTVERHLEILGNGDVFGIFSFLSLTIGAISYVTYRALFYPIIINPLVILCMKHIYHRHFPETKDISILKVSSFLDSKRWSIQNENVKKYLSEWASQVHFLYNLSIGCIIVLNFLSNDYYSKGLMITFFILLGISILHHFRYKLHEIPELLKSYEEKQEV